LQGVTDHMAYVIPKDVQRRYDALIVVDWHVDDSFACRSFRE